MLRATARTTRAAARVAIVNVASTAARVSRPNSGSYSVSKFALAAWSDALHNEEAPHGIHVGMVLPGFIKTEGFPAAELLANPATRWIVSRAGTGSRGDSRGRAPAARPSATSPGRTGWRRRCGSCSPGWSAARPRAVGFTTATSAQA